ncbi:MAG: M15 family metallopeptidase [Oscillospiraceae bacterium]|nr:M15 family metallopeptidase [Oscillospiraceae bacterium]
MARQKKQKADRAYYTFMLLMLSVVLVFAFGLMIGKQNNPQEAETVQKSVTVPKDNPTENETITASDTETVLSTQQVQNETVPEFKQATSFWSENSHIYLRVNHEKQLELETIANFDLSDAVYSVNDTNIASVDPSGMLTGLTKGDCIITISCNEETLHIPVTVRELTVIDGCTYVDGILIANKTYGMPETYDPGMLPETEEAFTKLQADARDLGLNIYEGSGYRTYQYQITVYKSMCDAYGEDYACRYSARPGYSEHQTGYTVDCNSIDNTFAETAEGQWLAENCHNYGFIIRYPEDKEDITGYAYESWHIRYVGIEAATEIYEQGLTLEEYLDVESVHVHTEGDGETADSETNLSETIPTETIPEEPIINSITPEQNTTPVESFADAPLDAPI